MSKVNLDHLRGHEHSAVEYVKEKMNNVANWAHEQAAVEREQRSGQDGPATKKAKSEGKYYHPFTGLTF